MRWLRHKTKRTPFGDKRLRPMQDTNDPTRANSAIIVSLHRRNKWLQNTVYGLFVGSMFVAVLGMGAPALLPLIPAAVGTAILAGLSMLFLDDGTLGPEHYASLIRGLAASGHKNDLPTLVDAYDLGWACKDEALRKGCIRLLKQVGADDADLLNTSQKHKIWGYAVKMWRACPHKDEEFLAVTLYAMRYMGDAETLRAMRQLAGSSKNYHVLVSSVARECVPVLEARLQAQDVPQTLLRASSPDMRSETLLRPVFETSRRNASEDERLLRPITGQDEMPDA